jgi:hypothetical protein
VEWDRVVGGVDAIGKLDQAEDDADLGCALETAKQARMEKEN